MIELPLLLAALLMLVAWPDGKAHDPSPCFERLDGRVPEHR